MLSLRWFQRLLAVAIAVLVLGAAMPASACCGELPDWFFTVFLENQPVCSSRSFNGGGITWDANYRMSDYPTNFVTVYIWGDGVIPKYHNYNGLPHQQGAAYDSVSNTETWYWDPTYVGTRRVKIQFNVAANSFNDYALLIFECTPRGVQNVQVINVAGWFQ